MALAERAQQGSECGQLVLGASIVPRLRVSLSTAEPTGLPVHLHLEMRQKGLAEKVLQRQNSLFMYRRASTTPHRHKRARLLLHPQSGRPFRFLPNPILHDPTPHQKSTVLTTPARAALALLQRTFLQRAQNTVRASTSHTPTRRCHSYIPPT